MKTYRLELYTQQSMIAFDVVSSADNFQDAIATALDEAGTVLLDLADGGSLIVNSINTVAIVVYEVDELTGESDVGENNPPRLVKL